jgi:hypothetical protein
MPAARKRLRHAVQTASPRNSSGFATQVLAHIQKHDFQN